ncbi:PAS domain S-box protein [Methanoregula sp.]|jgi:PAS domain S-box-containing protein|uniref:PAS domain S-box protein n=1 Tax=Methanoregula sp. TaxID=2052170 RepID=UPI003C27E8EE
MSGDERAVESKGTIPECDAESVLDVIGQMLMTGTFDSTCLPKDPAIRQRLDEILITIGAVQNFALSLSKGDLDSRLEAKGISAGSLKSLQSNLKHLTWQTQQIATGDFSQRVDFMGEFSEAFNHMVMALDAGRAKMKQRELELSSLNARLLTEVTVRRQVVEELRLQNQIFETIAEGVYLIRASDGVIVYTNTKFEKMFGYEKGELIGRHVSVVNAPEDLMSPGDTAEEIMKALDENGEWRGEVKNIRKDGTTFWCLAVVSTFEHPEFGNVWISAHTDITTRKRAELQIAEFSRFIATLMDTLPVPIFYKDISGKYLGCNPPFEEYIGLPRNNLIGKTAYDISPKDLADRYTAADCEVFDNPVPQRYEAQVMFADGSRHDVIFYKAPFFNMDGSVAGLIGTFLDITERKQVEVALKESEERFRTMSETSLTGIYIFVNGVVKYTNPTFARILGYTPPEMIGMDPQSLVHPDDRAMVRERMEVRDAQKEEINVYECRLVTKDNRTLFVNIMGTRIPYEGRMAISGNLMDITEQKLAEEALRQVNKKLNLLSSITRHDINNQLFSLKAFLELSKEAVGNSPRMSEYILKEERAANAIEHQIAFTKEYQDLGVKAPVWQNVEAGIKKVLTVLPMREIRVTAEVNDLEVYADPLFEKVFYNLIDNALKYGGQKMTLIHITSQESEKGLIISVEDDGVGISTEDKKRLFSRGFGHHTGLGLFLSREILSITDITITENGEPGKGARFEIAVPAGACRYAVNSFSAE